MKKVFVGILLILAVPVFSFAGSLSDAYNHGYQSGYNAANSAVQWVHQQAQNMQNAYHQGYQNGVNWASGHIHNQGNGNCPACGQPLPPSPPAPAPAPKKDSILVQNWNNGYAYGQNAVHDAQVSIHEFFTGEKDRVWVKGHYDKNGRWIKGHWRRINQNTKEADER